MADGNGYGAKANQAASNAMQCTPEGCPNCVKQGLPVLLTIPTLADKAYADQLSGTIKPLLNGAPDLEQSGYVMRTLREGYVMAWYKTPPKGVKNEDGWVIARVHAGGYMTQTSFAAEGVGKSAPIKASKKSQKDDDFSCSRVAGYASALLFVIPQAKEAGEVWVAFSGHPWSPGVRSDHAAGKDLRKANMTCIDAGKASCDASISLTEDHLRAGVVDFDPKLDPARMMGNPYPIKPLQSALGDSLRSAIRSISIISTAVDHAARPEDASDICEQAEKILGKQGKLTMKDVMIVGLRDPEGVTAMAAERRFALSSTAAEWLMKFKDKHGDPNGHWLLQSAQSLQLMFDAWDNEKKRKIKNNKKYAALNGKLVVSEGRFNEMVYMGHLPEDAECVTAHMGKWISIPDDAELGKRVDDRKAKVNEKVTRTIKVPKGNGSSESANWKGFLAAWQVYDDQDAAQLAKSEQDHQTWLRGAVLKSFCKSTFDTKAPVDGLPYAKVISACCKGGPISNKAMGLSGKGDKKEDLGWWDDLLGPDPSQTENYLLRALLGNQESGFQWFKANTDKSTAWDTAKTLLGLDPVQHFAGEQTRALLTSLIGDATAVAAARDAKNLISKTFRGQLERLGESLMGQGAALFEKMDNLHIYKMSAPFAVASKIWRKIGGGGNDSHVDTMTHGSTKTRSAEFSGALAVDMVAGARAGQKNVNIYFWVQGDAVNSKPFAANDPLYELIDVKTPSGGQLAATTARITQKEAESLAERSMQLLKNGSAVFLSAGSGLLQILAMGDAMKAAEHGTPDERRAAGLTLLSSGMAVMAATMEIGEAGLKQFGKEAAADVAKSFAARLSAVGAFVEAVRSGVGVVEGGQEKDYVKFGGSAVSAALWLGVAYTGLAAADLVAGAALLSAVAWTGLGLLLVGVVLLVSYLIYKFKDTPLQAWSGRTIWGEDSDSIKYKSLAREQAALQETIIGAHVSFQMQTIAGELPTRRDLEMGNTHEATQRIQLVLELPKSAMMGMRWSMQIYAAPGKGKLRLMEQWTSDEVETGGAHFSPESRDTDTDGGLQRMTLTQVLPAGQLAESAYATVRVSLRELKDHVYTDKYTPFIDEKLTA
ncbi:MAG: T6SS effector BTH_I2691 family protein [Rhodanobacter sp.]